MENQSKGMAIAGLVLGILSLVLSFWIGWLGFIVGIVGIVVSAMAMKRCPAGKGMAIAGLVCSIVGVALGVLVIACVGCIVGTAGVMAASSM